MSRFLFLFFILGLSFAAAQTPSVLDTAPGASGATNAVATTNAPPPPPAIPAGTSLIPSGGYASIPADPIWPDGADGNPAACSTVTEEGKSFTRLVASQPDTQVQFYRSLDLPPGVTGIEISFRYRVAGLKPGRFPEDDARAILEFLDASKKPIGAAPPLIFAADASSWTTISERVPVPPGAFHLAVLPCLFHVDAGTLDLSDISVTVLSETDSATVAAAAADAAAKKLAEENAILDQEIAAPSTAVEIKTSSNRLVTADGKDVLLQGVNVGNLSIRPDEEHKILWSVHVALTDWHANFIRLPVLDGFWFGKGRGTMTSNDAEAYRAIVDKVIKIAAGKGDHVLVDLHRYLTPDASCVDFWKDAAARYKNNPAVLFDILNEPHNTTWDVWRNGGPVEVKGKNPTTIQSVGMQALVDTVRGTGAHNVIAAGGLGFAFDLTGIVNGYALDDKGGNGIMYATHFYNWHGGWAQHILGTAAKYPVLVGEFGADTMKMTFVPANKQEDPYTWAPDAIGFVQANHLNWTAWCFHTRANPNLLLDWDYCTPTPFWGAFAKEALGGKQFVMNKQR